MNRPHRRPGIFGEVLFDRFPDGTEMLGGAPFNVAWHLQGLGLAPLFMSRVGDDAPGQFILDRMRAFGMATRGVQIDPLHPTGRVAVSFEDGEPRYDILADAAWDFIAGDGLPAAGELALLYHGSLALRGAVSRQSFADRYRRAGVPLFVDVNLRAPWWQADLVRTLIGDATWLKLNDDELDQLVPGSAPQLARAGRLVGEHDLDLLILTRGAAGATAIDKSGECREVRPTAAGEVVDTVGAGDAFAAVVLLGLLGDWPLALTLSRAQELAGRIVGLRGATPQDAAFYAPLIDRWGLS